MSEMTSTGTVQGVTLCDASFVDGVTGVTRKRKVNTSGTSSPLKKHQPDQLHAAGKTPLGKAETKISSQSRSQRVPPAPGENRTQFWGETEDDDSLIRQIIAGVKTATACPKCQAGEDPLDDYYDGPFAVGDVVTVYDGRFSKRCQIRITEAYECPMDQLPDKLWRGEGVYTSAEAFRTDHIACWCDETDFDSTDPQLELVVWHFELVCVTESPGRETPAISTP